jgi:dihydrolipoamide dehydrogenase
MSELDVVIIGAGSAGLAARREVARVTDNYKVYDAGILGTTCARVGCMPSKVLIQAANDFYRREKFQEQGIYGAEKLEVKTDEVMKHVRKLRDRFVRGVDQGMSSWIDDKLERKFVTFKDAHTLFDGTEEIKFKKAIIATGSRPAYPQMLNNYKEKYCIDTDQVFEQESFPKKIAVIGTGVIGIELGQALSRLGLDVVIIGRRRNISGMSNPEINDYICDKFEMEMNIDFSGLKEVYEEKNQLKIITDKESYLVEKVIVTTGRTSNIDRLDIEKICSKFNKQEIPFFSKTTFQLDEHPHIFITGDVNNEKPLLHEASDEGRIAGFNCVSDQVIEFQTRTPIGITFSDPNIAFCGQTYQELKDEGVDFATGGVSFEGQGRSIVKLKEIGLLRIYGEKKSGKVLGAEMFGPDNEHIAHLLAWVISQKMTVKEVLALPFYHPAIEEGLRTALRDLRDNIHQNDEYSLEIFPKSVAYVV